MSSISDELQLPQPIVDFVPTRASVRNTLLALLPDRAIDQFIVDYFKDSVSGLIATKSSLREKLRTLMIRIDPAEDLLLALQVAGFNVALREARDNGLLQRVAEPLGLRQSIAARILHFFQEIPNPDALARVLAEELREVDDVIDFIAVCFPRLYRVRFSGAEKEPEDVIRRLIKYATVIQVWQQAEMYLSADAIQRARKREGMFYPPASFPALGVLLTATAVACRDQLQELKDQAKDKLQSLGVIGWITAAATVVGSFFCYRTLAALLPGGPVGLLFAVILVAALLGGGYWYHRRQAAADALAAAERRKVWLKVISDSAKADALIGAAMPSALPATERVEEAATMERAATGGLAPHRGTPAAGPTSAESIPGVEQRALHEPRRLLTAPRVMLGSTLLGVGIILVGAVAPDLFRRTYQVRLARPVTAGYRARVVAKASSVTNTTTLRADQAPDEQSEQVQAALSGALRVLKVDERGRPIERELIVETCTYGAPGAAAPVLRPGQRILATGKGTDQTFRSPGRALSRPAQQALKLLLGEALGQDGDDGSFDAAEQRALGASWGIDPKRAAEDAAGKLPPEKILGQATLRAVGACGDSRCLEVNLDTTLSKIPVPDPPAGFTGEISAQGSWLGSLPIEETGPPLRWKSARRVNVTLVPVKPGSLQRLDSVEDANWEVEATPLPAENPGASVPAALPAPPNCSDAGWCLEMSVPGRWHLRRVFATSPQDVWAVGIGGAALHFGGTAWKQADTGTDVNLLGVLGFGGTTLWSTGVGGALLRWEGQFWLSEPSGVTNDLYGLWGSQPEGMWVVGDGGTLLRRERGAWSVAKSGATTPLFAVWGSGLTDVFAIGARGTILHYDGDTWTPMESGTRRRLKGVWGRGPRDVWAVGDKGVILHYDGAAWRPGAQGVERLRRDYTGLTGSGKDVWAVGERGLIVHHDGQRWAEEDSGVIADLRDVFALGQQVWAVGDGGVVLLRAP